MFMKEFYQTVNHTMQNVLHIKRSIYELCTGQCSDMYAHVYNGLPWVCKHIVCTLEAMRRKKSSCGERLGGKGPGKGSQRNKRFLRLAGTDQQRQD